MNTLFSQISEVLGQLPDSGDKEATLLSWANRAARILHDSYDLPGTMVEQFFVIDPTKYVITFPWYVGAIRGMRLHNSSRQLTLQDMSPRYATSPWVQPYMKYRQLPPSPLITALTQSGTLTITLGAAEDQPLDVFITGQTPLASKVTETITFQAGETSKVTVNQWTQEMPYGIVAIRKSRVTETDVNLTQTADSLLVATIPNSQTEAINTRVQIMDWNITQPWLVSDNVVETLYKNRFIPMSSTEDSWFDTRLEAGLIAKVKEMYAQQTRQLEQAAVEKATCEEICNAVCSNIDAGKEMQVMMDANPLSNVAIRFPQRWGYNAYDRL